MIRFLAEVTRRLERLLGTPVNSGVLEGEAIPITKHFRIYYFDIKPHPTNSFWLDWGGYYDTFSGTQLEIYFGQYLQRVTSFQDLTIIPFSIYTKNRIVYIHIDRHTWLWEDSEVSFENVLPFLSNPLKPSDPANNIVREETAEVILMPPSATVKLSDNISGISLNQSFSISLINNNGKFDDEDFWNIFNTPLVLKKAIVENPQYEDFKTIRAGLVEDTNTQFDSFGIKTGDRLRTLDQPVCGLVLQENFSFAIEERALNKAIPIVYGQKRIKVLKLNANHYMTAEFVTNVTQARNRDGVGVGFSRFGNILVSDQDIDTVLVDGYSNNRIGQIIQHLITTKTALVWSASLWNTTETNIYINNSPQVNIEITGGTIRNAVQNVISNDMAFLIEQSDSRLTIRRYGWHTHYRIHNVSNKMITRQPEKSWGNAQNNYFSSCIINYNFIDNDNYISYLYNAREREAEGIYRRKKQDIYNTDLTTRNNADALARLLANRYLIMRQTIRISLGIDTGIFELLDLLRIDLTINGRRFSKADTFIIKGIDQAQDTLTLEEYGG